MVRTQEHHSNRNNLLPKIMCILLFASAEGPRNLRYLIVMEHILRQNSEQIRPFFINIQSINSTQIRYAYCKIVYLLYIFLQQIYCYDKVMRALQHLYEQFHFLEGFYGFTNKVACNLMIQDFISPLLSFNNQLKSFMRRNSSSRVEMPRRMSNSGLQNMQFQGNNMMPPNMNGVIDQQQIHVQYPPPAQNMPLPPIALAPMISQQPVPPAGFGAPMPPQYPQQFPPPQYPPFNPMSNPTLMTEVSMNGLMPNNTPLQNIQTYKIEPPCYTYAFLLPFPFCCMGLCMFRTTTIFFNNQNKQMTIQTYCGRCSCCATIHTANFADILSVKQLKHTFKRKGRTITKNRVIVQTRSAEIEVAGDISALQADRHEKNIEHIARKCGIYSKL